MKKPPIIIELPEAVWCDFLQTLETAELSAEAGFVGIASCLLAAARRRADRAEASGEPWAPALLAEGERAYERFSGRYGTVP
jgi:hypothetical protein